MSDFQALIESNRRLAEVVESKVSEIDSRVVEAEKSFESFRESADGKYKSHTVTRFKVGGEWGKYYPVRIDLRGGPVNLINIYRPDLYENKGKINGLSPESNPGTFTASLISIGDNWSHRTPFYAFDTYHERGTRFIGKVTNNYRIQAIWLWLRGGGVGYWLTHDSLVLDSSKVTVYDEESAELNGSVGVYVGGFRNPDRGVYHPAILEAEADPSLPASGYIRGVS
ncbi:hypothetical protein ACOCG1_003376 [Vibrio cholerae]